MGAKATIVDYGRGNLFSIANACEHCDAEVEITESPSRVKRAERVILPGVGAFRDGMDGLRERDLLEPLKEFIATGKPFLGICLGMQMLLEGSEEFGSHEGLGLIPGRVLPIPRTDAQGRTHKIPHIGWNGVERPAEGRSWHGTVLDGLPQKSYFYFVHSFTAVPKEEKHRLADAWYGGRRVSAAIGIGNVFGTQFHPERSGPKGLMILRNFLRL